LTALEGAPNTVGGYFMVRGHSFTKQEILQVTDVKGNIYV